MEKRKRKSDPEVMQLRDYKQQPGDMPVLIEGEAEGAIPNGTVIEKVWCEPGDANPLGTKGVVLASHRVDDLIGYFVEWETFPGKPVFVGAKKIGRA